MLIKIRLAMWVCVLGFILIISRFYYWQIINARDLVKAVLPQHQKKTIDTPYRGKILANDGSILVGNSDSWNLYAEPKNIKNIDEIANALSLKLVENNNNKNVNIEEEKRIINLLTNTEKSWVLIKNRIPTSLKVEIESMNLKGLGFDRDEIRKYPEASSAAHLLGFLGKDNENRNTGYFGLEGYYNKTLEASWGIQKNDTDIKGIPLLFGKSKKIPSYAGATLVTSIDKGVQYIVEKELATGLEKYGAISGSVIVMEPKTGGILAMASIPSFDPSKYWEYSNERFLNPVISASFEPGSIFKIITMSAAFDSEVITTETKCDICNGPLKVGEYEIQTWNNKYYPDSTMVDIIIHSDNVGMSFVAKKLGIKKNFEYLKKFRVGEKSEIDLQGEMTPKLRELEDWSEVDLLTSSFGQGIAVTPIQMITAANVIANNGIFQIPWVVDIIEVDGKKYSIGNKQKGKRIISQEASDIVTLMMSEAARMGESKWTHKKGFKVAGKTGTAQIPIKGHYDEEKTIASFVGFAPYDDPKFIMLVTLREPKSSPWSSETAAPMWYDIAEKLFFNFGIFPEN